MKLPRANCVNVELDRQLIETDMKKSNVRGASPGRKAHLVLREKLNRKLKPAPARPTRAGRGKNRSEARRSVYGKN